MKNLESTINQKKKIINDHNKKSINLINHFVNKRIIKYVRELKREIILYLLMTIFIIIILILIWFIVKKYYFN